MKRIIFVLCNILIAGIVCVEAANTYARVVRVSSFLNVREDAYINSPVVGKIENGKTVEVIETYSNGWARIQTGDFSGYAKSEFLERTSVKPQSSKSLFKKVESFLSVSNEDSTATGVFKMVLIGVLVLLAIALVGLFFAGLSFIIGLLTTIGLSGLGGGLVGLFLGYFFSNGNSDAAVTGMKWGFFIGCGCGVVWMLRDPIGAASRGISSLSEISKDQPLPLSQELSTNNDFTKIIEGGGDWGEDIKAKEEWDGALRDEKGKRWKQNSDGTWSKEFAVFIVCIGLLTSCSQSVIDEIGGKNIIYRMTNGTELEAHKITTSSGRDFYMVRIDSVTYEEAYFLQKDGWVLPRMLGAHAVDEHRYTSMATIEELLECNDIDLSTDLEDGKTITYNLKLLDVIKKQRANRLNGIWTSTRFWSKEQPTNYAMLMGEKDTDFTFKNVDYNVKLSAVLLKDAIIAEKEIPDSIYYVNDTLQVVGTRFAGADGYNYYVVCFTDSLYTWEEALAMEKDGWILPRTEGKLYQDPIDRRKRGMVNERCLHTEGLEPTIEGLSGHHPLLGSEGLSRQFCSLFHNSCWLGTPKMHEDAFMVGAYFGSQIKPGSVIEKPRNLKAGIVTLVKRIVPQPSGSMYLQENGRYLQPISVTGISGVEYEVVDPSGWHNLYYSKQDVDKFEKDQWHVMTVSELADILGIENNIERYSKIEHFDNPLFDNLFPRRNRYYFRDADSDIIWFESGINWMDNQPILAFSANDLLGGCAIRLVHIKGDESNEERTKANDPAAFGLKGPVQRVTTVKYNASFWSGEYNATSSVENSKREIVFSKDGRLLKDEFGNIYRYKNNGDFLKGNHDYTKLVRNKEGQIVEYNDCNPETDDESSTTIRFSYNEKGLLYKIEYSSWGEEFSISYKYYADGNVRTEVSSGTFEGGGGYEEELLFEYKNYDDNGNWTERVVKNRLQESAEGNNDVQSETIYIEKRDIKYHQ